MSLIAGLFGYRAPPPPQELPLESKLAHALRPFNIGTRNLLAKCFPGISLVKTFPEQKASSAFAVLINGETKTLQLINGKQVTHYSPLLGREGLEWEIFQQDETLEGAIAYDPYHRRIHYLKREYILERRPSFELWGTLSSTPEPTFAHPFFPDTPLGGFFRHYPNSQIRNQILSFLHSHYQAFNIVRLLGTGSFNTVWEVRYFDKVKKETLQKVLRIPKNLLPVRQKEGEMRTLSQGRFGAEFAQYVPNDPTIANFDEALVRNEQKELEVLTSNTIRQSFEDRSKLGEHQYTLIASLGEFLPNAIPLDDYLKGKTLSEAVVVSATRQLLLALQTLYQLGILHRDLKTGNVLVFEREEDLILKVFDFGLSHIVPKGEALSQSTLMQNLTETRLGTPMTMAPELFRQGKYGFATDLYGAGCILYELIFGESFRKACKSLRDVAYHSSQDHTDTIAEKMDNEDIKARFPEHHENLKALLIGLLSQENQDRPHPLDALGKFITDPPPSRPIQSWTICRLLFIGGAVFVAYQLGKRILRRLQPPLEDAPMIFHFQK